MHGCFLLGSMRTCVEKTKSQSIMHSPEVSQRECVCLSLSPVRKEGWSEFSGQTPFGWGSAPLYWPLCDSLIELSCQQAAQSQCRVHYVIQTHSGAPREVLGSADNSTTPSSNTQSSVASLCLLHNKRARKSNRTPPPPKKILILRSNLAKCLIWIAWNIFKLFFTGVALKKLGIRQITFHNISNLSKD